MILVSEKKGRGERGVQTFYLTDPHFFNIFMVHTLRSVVSCLFLPSFVSSVLCKHEMELDELSRSFTACVHIVNNIT